MALTDSLISYWKMDEASGNALDAHSTNDLTDTNTVGSAAGKISNARDFEADNSEYFVRASNASLTTGDIDFSFQAWVQLESKTAKRQAITKGGISDYEYGLAYANGSDRFVFEVNSTSSGFSVTSITANNFGSPSTATWYHIICWHDATNNQIGIAVNDGTANTSAYSSGVGTNATDFRIGAYSDFSEYWDGLIDEVGFWKRVLTSGERTQLYGGGAGLAYPFSGGGATVGGPLAGGKLAGGFLAGGRIAH